MDFKWEKLKTYLIEYKRLHKYEPADTYGSIDGRYCVAISIDDLLEKMEELEDESQAKAMYRRMTDYIMNRHYGGTDDERS